MTKREIKKTIRTLQKVQQALLGNENDTSTEMAEEIQNTVNILLTALE